MSRRRPGVARRAAYVATMGALAVFASGCGDPDLWARFRAERGMWRVVRQIRRIEIDPGLASAADFARAEQACREVLAAFPPGVWAVPAKLDRRTPRQVATQAGRAALALGRIAELRGAPDEALRRYATVLADWGEVRGVALDAAIARAKVYDATGRTAEAAAAWGRIAVGFDPRDEEGRLIAEVLEAPRRAAAFERELGRERAARAVLDSGAARIERLIGGEAEPARAVRWWVALAENRAVAGDRAAALAAWRRALSGAGSDVQAEDLRLALAREALAAGLPDTALAVVAPLAAAWRLEIRLEAMLLSGRAFAAMGQLDSALVRWDRVADDHPNSVEAAAEARYLRGTGLESANRWEEARTEFRALGASYPAHRLAIRAMGRIVEYHARRGQTELARIEGLRAITALDRLILRQRDLDVQFEARLERARLLERIGSATEAFDALLAFWRRYPRSYDGQEAGLRAAAIADSALDDQALAADLYREMEARPVRTVVRDRVRAGLEALGVKE